MGPLLGQGCWQSPKPGAPARAALEALAEDKGIATSLGGQGACTPTKGTLWGSPSVLQCKFTESQGTTMRPWLCTGQPAGHVQSRQLRSPVGQRRSEPEGHGNGPHSAARLVQGYQLQRAGAMQPRGEPAPRDSVDSGRQPVQRRWAWGAHPGSPRDPAPGVVAARGDAGSGHSSLSCGSRGDAGVYRGGAGSPPSPRRCVSLKVRSSCSSWELNGRWISRCMRRVSSHCSSLLKDGRFSGSRSQQQTAMGKKLGGQAGGQ